MNRSLRSRCSGSHALLAGMLAAWPLVAAAQPSPVTHSQRLPHCLPSTPSQGGIPRIPATLEPPGTVAPIVRPFEDLSPLPAPPAAMTELPAVPLIESGRTDAIEDRIRELRGRLTRTALTSRDTPSRVSDSTPPSAKPTEATSPPAASPSNPMDSPPPPIPSEKSDPLANPPPVPIGAVPKGPVHPAPGAQQSITAHRVNGLDPATTNLTPPAPPPVSDDSGPGLLPARGAGQESLGSPPAPPVTEINLSTLSALSIPVEILRSPIDHIALADNLYAAKSYGLALEAYQAAAKASVAPPARRWASFQVANCYRLLGQPAEAERQYRRLAGDRDGGQFSDLSRWWLQSMDQKSQLSAQLEQVQGAMQSASAAATAAAGPDQENSRVRPLSQP